MIKKFRGTGSLLDKNRNRQKSVLTPGILQDIQTAITRSPHKSLRELSAQTGITLGSAHTAVRKTLKFYQSETVLQNFLIIFVIALFTGACLLKFFKKTLSTVDIRHRF